MKERELDTILHLLKGGFTKKKVREKLGVSKSVFANRLRELENLGYILRKGKYEIQILPSSRIHPRVTKIPISKKLNKRGHAHNFKVIFPSEENLKEKPLVKEFILKSKRKPKILPFGSIKFKFKRYTIWINKDSLTIYSNNSYYSQDALHSKFMALKDIDLVISTLKQKFAFRGLYGIEIFREHYGLIFNKFAEWILSKGGKLDVKNKGNKTILWVDDSKKDDIGLKEFEGSDPQKINKADKYFEDQEKTNWEVTPSFLMENINKLTDNQSKQHQDIMLFAEQLNRHIPAYEGMSKITGMLLEEIKDLKKEIAKIKR
jgi:hypothetical protein